MFRRTRENARLTIQMDRHKQVGVGVGVLVSITHLCAIWVCWAVADTVPSAANAFWPGMLFRFLSFPLITLLPPNALNRYFQLLLLLNASFWGAAAGLLIVRYTGRSIAHPNAR